MSARDTAARVLRWAARADGPPPAGDLADADHLVTPDAAAAAAAGVAATAAAGRLGWALGAAAGAVGPEVRVLAAAVGARDRYPTPDGTTVAELLLGQLRPGRASVADLLARHAVAGAALPHLTPRTADACRAASPLTAVLDRPPAGGSRFDSRAALTLADGLVKEPAARRVLVRWLARPTGRADVLRWRAELFEKLRLGAAGRAFVLDVYEAAVGGHRADWEAATRAAAALLDTDEADTADDRLEVALRTAGWWGPLAALERSHRDEIRDRAALDTDVYEPGLNLFRRVGRLA